MVKDANHELEYGGTGVVSYDHTLLNTSILNTSIHIHRMRERGRLSKAPEVMVKLNTETAHELLHITAFTREGISPRHQRAWRR